MTDAATKLTALAERIELWPVERLRPYERNPRTHSEDQVAQLAASMVEFGFTNPILVDESNGILAGHGRLMAARQLGLAEVPVVRLEHLSEAQKRAYIIADNQLAATAGWDETLLAEEVGWLQGRAVRSRPAGLRCHRAGAAAVARRRRAEAAEPEDEVPEPPKDPVTRPGDLWLLGEHRLLCGDATVLDRCRAGARRGAGRHGLDRPALQCRLRQHAPRTSSAARAARSSTTISATASRRS